MKRKKIQCAICLITALFLLTGCWNYKDVEKFALVSGFAVDKKGDNLSVTFEVVDVNAGKEVQINPQLITSEGATLFEAARKSIKSVGKRLYFGHAEIVVVSKEIAENGIVPILDWINRDSELRYSLHLLISKDKPAREILSQKPVTMDILSLELKEMLHSQESLSYAVEIEEWQFMQALSAPGISAVLPVIDVAQVDDKSVPAITGTAVFSKDRLVGFLDGEETKAALFVKNKIKGGILVTKEDQDGKTTNIALEVFGNKTKLTPRYVDDKIIMEIKTETDVGIDEISSTENYLEGAGLAKLQADSEAMLEDSIRKVVKKTQEEYGCDIFGFGKTIKLNMPAVWKQIESKWDDMYKNTDIEVHSSINIRNTAFHAKTVKVGD